MMLDDYNSDSPLRHQQLLNDTASLGTFLPIVGSSQLATSLPGHWHKDSA